MNTETYSTTRTEADKIRAARGFANFKTWKRQNRQAAAMHRKARKIELAEALDREYDRFIRSHV